MEQRDRYIEYVRTLRERVANKATQSGVTAWALSGAIIYLVWQTIPLYSQINKTPNSVHLSFFLLGHMLAFMVGAWLLFNFLVKREFHSEFDHRLERDISGADAIYMAAIAILQVGFPATINLEALGSAHSLENIYWVYQVNAYGLVFLFALVVISLPILLLYKKHTGFSPVTGIKQKNRKWVSAVGASVDIVPMALVPINVYGIYATVLVSPSSQFTPVFLTAFNTTLIVWALAMLMKSYRAANSLALFEKLERDIIMHNLTDSQIRDRLEAEYLGQELGGWIGSQIKLIRSHAMELDSFCAAVAERVKEIRSIEVAHKYERAGRLKSINEGIGNRVNILAEAWKPFQRWLTYTDWMARTDSYAESHVKSALTELSELRNKAINEAERSLKLLNECLAAEQ